MTKTCCTCKIEKEDFCFTKNKNTFDGLTNQCKECRKKYNERNKDRDALYRATHKYNKKSQHLRYYYGISIKEWEKLIEDQKGICPICREYLLEDRKSHLDHCHKTGKIRGILCSKCNYLLGVAKDDTVLLKRAIKYLKRDSSNYCVSEKYLFRANNQGGHSKQEKMDKA